MSDRIPKLVKGMTEVDLRALPLGPVDGFVLSRIDGTMTAHDIASTTGLGDDAVKTSLAKLESLGILEMAPSNPPPARGVSSMAPKPPPCPTPRVAVMPGSGGQAGNINVPRSPATHVTVTAARPQAAAAHAPAPSPAPTARTGPLPAGMKYDPRELEEDVDLTVEQRQKVLDLFYRLNEVDYYALLNIPRSADKKAVKRAYFELASLFHPDKFFRKRLGNFQSKMEAIFGRITEAHDTLTSKAQRPEYDAYLGAQEQSRGIESLMESAMIEVRRAEEELRRNAKKSIPPSGVQITNTPVPARGFDTNPPRPISQSPMARVNTPAADPQALRDALARRLMGGNAPAPVRAAAPAKAPTNYASAQDAVDALRRRYEDRLTDAHGSQAKKYMDAAKEAVAKKDLVGAANAYRIALSFSPNDAELKAAYEETQRSADTLLADSYLQQAQYEERVEHWPEAAKSWGRVARARPEDARAFERHANSLVRASGNLHEAAASAKRAVALDGSRADYKLTLATVYVAAGLNLNAKRELEAAVLLDPENAAVQAMLKRMKTG